MTIYKEQNVYEAALDRIRMIFDYHDDVIISMSGGKDSTVLFNLALIVAKEKNRLPLKVFWLDQECEWQATVDYMDWVMRQPDVKPYWFQIPFDFTNSLSAKNNFIRVWDETKQDKWVHQKADISIKENPSKYTRFHDLVSFLPEYCTDSEDCAVLVGMRIKESLNRRMAISHGKPQFRGETWCQKKRKNIQVFWPVYDFNDDDIWTAIAKNHWKYNTTYDIMYRWGVPKQSMRVSALIHETAWHSIEMLQEFERATYNKFIARVPGVSTFNHCFDEGGIIPKALPFAFKDWKEYRDYLLIHITKPEYHEMFRNRWKNQDGDEWYKVHVKEIILNDIDGTNNSNARSKMIMNERRGTGGKYHQADINNFNEYVRCKND
jgi:predicted phosphoadenosine phosphosulfate sulfurtransferase